MKSRSHSLVKLASLDGLKQTRAGNATVIVYQIKKETTTTAKRLPIVNQKYNIFLHISNYYQCEGWCHCWGKLNYIKPLMRHAVNRMHWITVAQLCSKIELYTTWNYITKKTRVQKDASKNSPCTIEGHSFFQQFIKNQLHPPFTFAKHVNSLVSFTKYKILVRI